MVVSGHCIAQIAATGSDTEMGRIGRSLKSIKDEETLLKKEIKKISVQELDILAQEAASLKGGQTVKPFTNDVQTNKHSIVAPAPYKGEPGVHGSFYI